MEFFLFLTWGWNDIYQPVMSRTGILKLKNRKQTISFLLLFNLSWIV